MKTLKKLAMLAVLMASALAVSAQVFDFNIDPANQPIPDGDANGIQDTRTVTGAGPFPLGFFMKVKLNIQGLDDLRLANNGDYYVTLAKGGTLLKSVLVNRPGKPLNQGAGYGDNGMNITLQDFLPNGTAAPDVHNYQNVLGNVFQSPLTGVWSPDGRNADPSLVTANRADAINQPLKMLSVFDGTNPNGDWTLFVADMASGGQGKLVSWGLEFVAVPEPHEYAFIAGLALIGFALYRRYTLKIA